MYNRRISPMLMGPTPQMPGPAQGGVTPPMPPVPAPQPQEQGLLGGVGAAMPGLLGMLGDRAIDPQDIVWSGPRTGGVMPEMSGDLMPMPQQMPTSMDGGAAGPWRSMLDSGQWSWPSFLGGFFG